MNDERPEIADAAPTCLNHVIAAGANLRVKESIRVALEATFATGEAFPHTLLAGCAGTGKSMYAAIVAREMGMERPVAVLGQTVQSPASLNGILLGLDERQVLLIDEVHTLDADCQHALLRAMENREVYLEGVGSARKPKTIRLPPFTLIGATTDPHVLISPLLDRFRLQLQLATYEAEELVSLLRQRTRALGWSVEHDDVFLAVACRARGTPRVALRLLESVRRVTSANGSDELTIRHALQAFELEGLDSTGLTPSDRDYLLALYDSGKPLRLNVLATRLMMPAQSVVKLVETHLVREGLVLKGDGGRSLTDRGMEYARALAATD